MSSADAVVVAGSIGGVATSAESLANGASQLVNGVANLLSGNWQNLVRTASYGGVPFAVEAARSTGGRRNAIHDYPFRDEIWVEDLGKLPRQFNLAGFLIEDSLIYGGGSVITQRNNMLKACETAGSQTLVHPTYGEVPNVNCLSVEFNERKDLGRVVEVNFTFILSGARIFPNSKVSGQDSVGNAAKGLLDGSVVDFVKGAAAAISKGAAIARAAVSAAVGFYQLGVVAVHDVNRFLGAVSTLSGNFGRLFGGGNDGYQGSNQKAPAGTTVATLMANDTVVRQAVTDTGAAMQAAAAAISDPSAFCASAQAFVQAVSASASDPADAVRMLMSMVTYTPTGNTSNSQIGVAIATIQTQCGNVFRRTVLAALAQACATYQPASQQDAQTLSAQMADAIDAEIEIAGDAGDDASYTAMRTLRQAVITDLQSRSAGLAAVTTFSFPTSLPALVLANRIYRDATRSDGLVQQANPIHPAFMPTSFQALAN